MSNTAKPASTRLTIVSLTIPEGMLAEVDALTASQDMTRSQYFRGLARRDLAKSKRKSPSPAQPQTVEAA
jgi:metal-responsive CopG/Arc/MetJ family transcriptional regulator